MSTGIEDYLERRLIDVYVSPARGSLMRSISLRRNGLTRICRRDAELYSLQITCGGSAGRLKVTDESGAILFYMPSAFTGSFVIAGSAVGGITVDMQGSPPSTVTPNWRERDTEIV